MKRPGRRAATRAVLFVTAASLTAASSTAAAGSGRQVLLDPLLDLGTRNRADHLVDQLPVLEEEDGRDRQRKPLRCRAR